MRLATEERDVLPYDKSLSVLKFSCYFSLANTAFIERLNILFSCKKKCHILLYTIIVALSGNVSRFTRTIYEIPSFISHVLKIGYIFISVFLFYVYLSFNIFSLLDAFTPFVHGLASCVCRNTFYVR